MIKNLVAKFIPNEHGVFPYSVGSEVSRAVHGDNRLMKVTKSISCIQAFEGAQPLKKLINTSTGGLSKHNYR